MRANRAEELAQIDPNPDRVQAGTLQIKLCRDYENAVKTQEPATTAAAQGLVNAINAGGRGRSAGATADNAKLRIWDDEAAGGGSGAFDVRLAGR